MKTKEKTVERSIRLAQHFFMESTEDKNSFHYAFLWRKNTLISTGENQPNKPSAKAVYFANRFNLKKQKKYPYLHAELDAISKAWGKIHIDGKFSLVSLRLSKGSGLLNAKPCKNCLHIINSIGINKLYWSNSNGYINGKILRRKRKL